jgi:hypothetical protein
VLSIYIVAALAALFSSQNQAIAAFCAALVIAIVQAQSKT